MASLDGVREWRGRLAAVVSGLLFFLGISGLSIYLLPFSRFSQLTLLVHTAVGLILAPILAGYGVRHVRARWRSRFNHLQLLGYATLAMTAACLVSGMVETWQGVVGPTLATFWDQLHLISGIAVLGLGVAHLTTVATRKAGQAEGIAALRAAKRLFGMRTLVLATALTGGTGMWTALHRPVELEASFPDDYNWRFGSDRPFAPSLARTEPRSEAIHPRALAGSERCGSSGCHVEIVREWLPSAHRYSAMDKLFQAVQELMVQETSPEHTRYCAGCHDPISLLAGAKSAGNVTLSAEGAHEGSSCLVCHSIVQVDTQGNADYTIREPRRYVFELSEGRWASAISDFLIRTYPDHHKRTYARALLRTPEFCAACHKQYIDKQVNTDIGRVVGQNQYDSWRKSRWFHEGEPAMTVECRECHMPLVESRDPAAGDRLDENRSPDDGKHRSHRFLASNQYIPLAHNLEGAEEHTRLTIQWLRGEIEIPEIAHKWATGPVVRMEIIAPEAVTPGEAVVVRVVLTNNKAGHDFPTGPLDMIESWVTLEVTDAAGTTVYAAGGLDAAGVIQDAPIVFKADGFDRHGEPIDRHNLWDLVGASYKRSLYPGFADMALLEFQCPSMARPRTVTEARRTDAFRFETLETGTLELEATLWYRKANAAFMDRVFGAAAELRTPVTEMSRATATIRVSSPVPPTSSQPG